MKEKVCGTASRRTFVKAAGLALAGATVSSFMGCSGKKNSQDTSSLSDITWDEEYDVVVVGGGLAGMSTAITVATEGEGEKCLLLEKGDLPTGGGNSQYSSGRVTFTDDPELYLQYLKDLRGDFAATAPDDVLEALARGMGENYTWIIGLGANESDLTITNPDGNEPQEYGEFAGSVSAKKVGFSKTSKNFTHIVPFIESVVEQHADVITHKTGAQVTALIQDADSKTVVGVSYSEKGATKYAKGTKGIVMCCGGFENDEAMKENYLGSANLHAVAGLNNTGDGHRMCARLQADFWHMHGMAGFWNNGVSLDGKNYNQYRTLNKDQGITVGVNGRRFYMDYDMATSGWPTSDTLDSLSTDVGSRHGHQQFGGDWSTLPMPATTWFVFDQSGADNKAYTAGTQDIVADGFGYKADTIEELAAQMHVPGDELVATVALWNQYCSAGKDASFYRPPSTLHALVTPPYYAMKMGPEMINTDGGPVRDSQGEIIDIDGNPIPHLYSAGEFGSVWTYSYQGGGNLGECCAFGRIAARNALGL